MTDSPEPRLFIFGDSHASALARGARMLGIPHAGGGTMRGLYWDQGRYALSDDGRLDVHEVGRAPLARGLAQAGVESLFNLTVPIVTTVAFIVARTVALTGQDFTVETGDDGKAFLSSGFFRDAVLARRRPLFDLLERLNAPEHPVIVVSSPPRPKPPSLAVAFEAAVLDELARLGISAHHTRPWSAGADGLMLPAFVAENDGIHGNALYGAHCLARIAPLIGLDAVTQAAIARRPR